MSSNDVKKGSVSNDTESEEYLSQDSQPVDEDLDRGIRRLPEDSGIVVTKSDGADKNPLPSDSGEESEQIDLSDTVIFRDSADGVVDDSELEDTVPLKQGVLVPVAAQPTPTVAGGVDARLVYVTPAGQGVVQLTARNARDDTEEIRIIALETEKKTPYGGTKVTRSTGVRKGFADSTRLPTGSQGVPKPAIYRSLGTPTASYVPVGMTPRTSRKGRKVTPISRIGRNRSSSIKRTHNGRGKTSLTTELSGTEDDDEASSDKQESYFDSDEEEQARAEYEERLTELKYAERLRREHARQRMVKTNVKRESMTKKKKGVRVLRNSNQWPQMAEEQTRTNRKQHNEKYNRSKRNAQEKASDDQWTPMYCRKTRSTTHMGSGTNRARERMMQEKLYCNKCQAAGHECSEVGRGKGEPAAAKTSQQKLMKYAGHDAEWVDWKAQFDNFVRWNEWSAEECRHNLIASLKGDALAVYSDNPNVTYEELVTLLEDRFAPSDRHTLYQYDFDMFDFKNHMTPESYGQELTRLARKAYKISRRDLEPIIISRYCRGISDEAARRYVMLNGPYTSLREAVTTFAAYRAVTGSKAAKKPHCNQISTTRRDNPGSQGGVNQIEDSSAAKDSKKVDPMVEMCTKQNKILQTFMDRQTKDMKELVNTLTKITQATVAGSNKPPQKKGNDNQNTVEEKPRKVIKCHYCDKVGHGWVKCRKRLTEDPEWKYEYKPVKAEANMHEAIPMRDSSLNVEAPSWEPTVEEMEVSRVGQTQEKLALNEPSHC